MVITSVSSSISCRDDRVDLIARSDGMHLGVVCILVNLVDFLVVASMGLLVGKGSCGFCSMEPISSSLEGIEAGRRESTGERLSSSTSFIGGWKSIGSRSSSQMEKRVRRSFSILQLMVDTYISEIGMLTTR